MPILAVSGPPGAGKSTVSRMVAAAWDQSICMESDWFWTTFVNGFIPPWEPAAQSQNEAVVGATFAAADRLARGGYHVVVDGLLGPWFLPLAQSTVSPDTELAYVLLRPDEETSVHRATTRPQVERTLGHPPLRDPAVVRKMWQQLADLGELESHVLDTTDLTEQQTAQLVLEGFAQARWTLP